MVRVHELATELGVPSSKVLEVLMALGVEAKAHMSTLTDADAARVKAALSGKAMRTSTISGKRDFRVRDISAPSKSPSVRPRPTLQPSEPPRRTVTKRVVKRVVRRAAPSADETRPPAPPREPAKPELPDIEKAVKDIDRSMTSVGAPPPSEGRDSARRSGKSPSSAATGEAVGTEPRRGRARRRERPRGKPAAPPAGREDKGGSTVAMRPADERYAPVGKSAPKVARPKRPKPDLPKIPSPEDYLRPREADFKASMQKLATDGLRTSIDTKRSKVRGDSQLAQTAIDRKRKRRRKIIKDDRKGKPAPQGGRGRSRNIRQQLQSQMDTASTVRKRGKPRLRRERERIISVAEAGPRKIRFGEHVSIKELSAQTGLKSAEIIGFLMKELEVLANINQTVDQEIAALICDHFGFECEIRKARVVEDVLRHEEDKPEDLASRPPVVTVLGHVDHGKTKLLDAIRGTDVVATEAGGITQKIGAFQVSAPTRSGQFRPITFIDTPGHAAFTAMRARGAEVTDIAVLVVAADDGVMPQTLEAIDHARSAGVEIVVAINKIDLPDANPEVVKQQLSEHGLVPEEWGGQVIMVPISAKKKVNIEELLEQVLTVADILELKANPSGMAEGAIIEARLDKGRGALATVLVKRGTLDVGDYVVAGCTWGRIRQMTDDDGNPIEHAGPSTPVLVSGLNTVPEAGNKLHEVADERTAREIYDKREMDHRQGRLRMVNTITLEDFYEQLAKGETKELNIILKADLQGSIEALRGQLEQLATDEVGVRFIHTAVGNITDSDIMLAMASKAVIIGFNVVASPEIRKQAAMEGVDIRTYNIIYKAVEDIQAALEGMLEPEYQESVIGRAEVRQLFKRTGKLIVAGLFVTEGRLVRGGDIRILREGEKIADVRIANLKRFKDDVKDVEGGQECGMMLEGYNDLKEGDEIVAFEVIKVLRTLETAAKAE